MNSTLNAGEKLPVLLLSEQGKVLRKIDQRLTRDAAVVFVEALGITVLGGARARFGEIREADRTDVSLIEAYWMLICKGGEPQLWGNADHSRGRSSAAGGPHD